MKVLDYFPHLPVKGMYVIYKLHNSTRNVILVPVQGMYEIYKLHTFLVLGDAGNSAILSLCISLMS